MHFETEADVLKWFESEERVLTPEFLNAIPWQEVSKHGIDERFIPVLVYMRDIEKMTGTYYEELKLTPTWRDKSVRTFMDRWSEEEPLHGNLLCRFLEEAGYSVDEKWFDDVRARMGLKYKANVALQAGVAHIFGRSFAPVHMTIGAINELTTLNGYQRLWKLAGHPVLEQILRGIVREEARHYFFYWSVARIKLLRSPFAQKLNRAITSRFWVPVGQGIKTAKEANQVIATLFHGKEGLSVIDQRINQTASRLPGLEDFKAVSERIRASITSGRSALEQESAV